MLTESNTLIPPAEGVASRSPAFDIIAEMEDDVRSVVELVRGIMIIAENGALHRGLDEDECAAVRRISGQAHNQAGAARDRWEQAFAAASGGRS